MPQQGMALNNTVARCLILTMPMLAIIPYGTTAHAQSADTEDYINPDRPGIADGSAVIGAGRFQIETGIEQAFRSGGNGYNQTIFIPTLLRLGVTDHLEIRIEGNGYTWVGYDSAQQQTNQQGIAPVSIGFKYQFTQSDGWQHPSIGVIGRLFPPTGTGGLNTTRTTGDFRLAADWDFAPKLSLNPNIGVAIYEDGSQRTFTAGLFALTLNYNPSEVLNFFVDTGMQAPEVKHGKTAILWDIGTAFIIGHNLQLDFSVGAGAAGLSAPNVFWAAGISQRF